MNVYEKQVDIYTYITCVATNDDISINVFDCLFKSDESYRGGGGGGGGKRKKKKEKKLETSE